MSFLSSLIAWQNMLFTATAGLGTLLFGVQALGAFGSDDHDADADHDTDLDHDHDFDHDADADHDVDADADADADADHDHDVDQDADGDGDGDADHDHDGGAQQAGDGALVTALHFVGIGRLPFSMLMPIALTSFGFAGLFASLAFGGIGKDAGSFREMFVFPMLGLALAGSIATIQIASRVYRKLVPDNEKTASDRYDLLGLVGVVKSGKVDVEFGQVQVKDSFGHELDLPCIALDRDRGASYGEEVVLVDWDPALNRFKIVPFSEAERDETKRLSSGKLRARELRIAAKSQAQRG